ncbi:hypothetical protein [Delftia acidovorans]|uniref:hypothetical protein n=1 Tax=Delftia acidovorans TaxID=80866 RepID=UPI0012FDDBE3|nr:hypothetical protein [Delftia acidovorans]
MAAGEKCPIDVGNHVRLLSVPAWLLKDLPSDEQLEMLSYIGRIACVQSIDAHGYIGWDSVLQFNLKITVNMWAIVFAFCRNRWSCIS